MSFIFDWLEIHAVDHCNNACEGCNNHSPYAPKRQYQANDYIPWIRRMLDQKMTFKSISIMGGEPFLHTDLHGFVFELADAFDLKLVLSTNGFWLSPSGVKRHKPLLSRLSLLNLTVYPPLAERFGGMERIPELLDLIRNQHPGLDIVVRKAFSFYVLEFTEEPMVVDRYCGAADCTCLLPDGRLARCGPGAFADLSPHVSKAFLQHRGDIFYDLKSDTGDFWMWRRRWPLEACRYCTHFTRKTKPWRSLRPSPRNGEQEEG
jgi:hypothetical protein